MELVSDYMRNTELRHKLNRLTKKTFGFDFEHWVVNGYFEGDYIPYSFLEQGEIISNVSANRMRFLQNGVPREYIQLGTVMTKETYRNRGLARKLMEYVVQQYEDNCDGIYLFGDLSAVEFYRKLGFMEGLQYRYRLKPEEQDRLQREPKKSLFLPINREDIKLREHYLETVWQSAVYASLEQINKFGLQLFYTADLSNVFYAKELDCFVVLEQTEQELCLQSIICKQRLPLQEIISCIGGEQNPLVLGFSPCNEETDLFVAEPFDGGEEYRLFYRGNSLDIIQAEQLYFPELSHA